MDVLSQKSVVTRKDHKCWGCRRTFQKGTKMDYTATLNAGSVHSSYWCVDCQKVINSLDQWRTEDGFTEGDLIDNYPELYTK